MNRIDTVDLLDPTFRQRLLVLMHLLEGTPAGILRIYESSRAPSRQAALYARGRDPSAPDYGRTVTRAQPWQSAHQWGLAVDLVPLLDGVWSWDSRYEQAWTTMAATAPQLGLECLSFERPHVQLAGFDWRKLAPGPDSDDAWETWLRTQTVPPDPPVAA